MHPQHDVRLAEELYKTVYERVRASPRWNTTVLLISFDEHGGFWDGKLPPTDGVPAPWPHYTTWPDIDFKFDRLGVRIPLIVVSPFVKKGTVVSAPPAAQKPQATSQYDHTSIISTVRKWFGMTSAPLTRRDAWAATFEHVLDLDAPRSDCPARLVPPAPYTAGATRDDVLQAEARAPISPLQREIMQHTHMLTDGAPRRRSPHPDTLATEREAGDWLRRATAEHKELHAAWARGSALAGSKYELVVAASVSPVWLFGNVAWDLTNASACGAATRWTVATRKVRDPHTDAPYCLTANVTARTVTAAPCHFTADPCKNRNSAQWFTGLQQDYSLRPMLDASLAVTSPHAPSTAGDSKIFLAKHDPAKYGFTQSWSWNGAYKSTGRGASVGGELMMGDGVYIVGMKVKDL